MTNSKPESHHHFRGRPRAGRRMEVRYRVEGAYETGPSIAAETRNISLGGAFIVTTDPAPPGSELTVILDLPTTGRSLSIRGEVRWISDGEDEPDHGMGVRFVGLRGDDLADLNRYFISLAQPKVDVEHPA